MGDGRKIERGAQCKFCHKRIPAENAGAVAWGICDDCWHDVEFPE